MGYEHLIYWYNNKKFPLILQKHSFCECYYVKLLNFNENSFVGGAVTGIYDIRPSLSRAWIKLPIVFNHQTPMKFVPILLKFVTIGIANNAGFPDLDIEGMMRMATDP